MSTSLLDVQKVLRKWLHFAPEDVEIIDLVLATAIAVRLKGEPLWVILVDAPGAGKTELIRALRGLSCVQFVSTLSPKTLISGFRPGGRDYSLLPKLDGKLLAIKDLTPIMDMPAEQQRQIFGTLRDAYDGFSDHARGNMDAANYEASFGLLAGCTDVIDLPRRIAEQELGDRYLKVRYHDQDSDGLTRKAWENSGREEQMRQEIAKAVQSFLTEIMITYPLLRPPLEPVMEMAKLLAQLRAPVRRDRFHHIVSPPKAEKPTRLVKQLTRLVQLLAVVRGHSTVTEKDLATAWRVTLDTPTPIRSKVYLAILESGRGMCVEEISSATRLPCSTVRETSEDLWAIGLLNQETVDSSVRYQIRGGSDLITQNSIRVLKNKSISMKEEGDSSKPIYAENAPAARTYTTLRNSDCQDFTSNPPSPVESAPGQMTPDFTSVRDPLEPEP